jgi:hypothetical protein
MRLPHEISGMRIGMENGFGKSGKQRIEDNVSNFFWSKKALNVLYRPYRQSRRIAAQERCLSPRNGE